jgi:hypothetical protein
MAKRIVSIQPPVGGLYKRQSYQKHPPFTTPSSKNVWLDNSLEGRERVGTRPGLVAHGTTAGASGGQGDWSSADNVRAIGTVRYLSGGAFVQKVVAVVDNEVWWKTGDETGEWAKVTSESATPIATGSDSLTMADIHQKLYIADGDGTYTFKIFNPSDNTINVDPQGGEIEGTLPTNCKIGFRYQDRYVLAEDSGNPNLWYMSASGNPLDFDYTQTDALAAVNGQNTNAGELGEPIRAAAPHGDQCIIWFGEASTWTMRSDPGFGGRLDNLSQTIGCVSRNAWCRSPEGWLFWLSLDGVCAMPPGCGDTPISVSRERVPDDLLFVDTNTGFHVSMCYDIKHRGIYLFISGKSTSTQNHYWLDVKQTLTGDKGASPTYWPIVLSNLPVCCGVYEGAADDDTSDVLIGSKATPVIEQLDETVDCEDDSFIDIGPLSTTGRQGSFMTGTLDQLNIVLATDSTFENTTLEIRHGETPEEAFDATADYVYTLGRHNNTIRPRLRDPYYVLRIKGAAGVAWAMENISAVIQPRTKVRFTGGV